MKYQELLNKSKTAVDQHLKSLDCVYEVLKKTDAISNTHTSLWEDSAKRETIMIKYNYDINQQDWVVFEIKTYPFEKE